MKVNKWILLSGSLAVCFLTFGQVTVSTVTQEFSGSGGVKIGPDGLVYIADYGDALPNANGTQISTFDPSSGSLNFFTAGLSGASGNAFDSQGNLIQSNIASSTISTITPTGSISLLTSTGINSPVGIATDENDNVFVCNCGDNTIRKVTSSGISTLYSANPGYNCPNGITLDDEGNLYVSNFNDGGVYKIDTSGVGSLLAIIPGGNNGHLAFNHTDNHLYVCSHGSSRIYRVSLSGSVSVFAGSGIRGNLDGLAGSAQFSRPNGIAISESGDTIFVNSSVPVTNTGFPLNPSLLRMITGVQSSVSLPEVELPISQLDISPNPSKGIFEVQFTGTKVGDYTLELQDLTGKLILDRKINLNANQYEWIEKIHIVAGPGVYLLTLECSDQLVQRRIIIE